MPKKDRISTLFNLAKEEIQNEKILKNKTTSLQIHPLKNCRYFVYHFSKAPSHPSSKCFIGDLLCIYSQYIPTTPISIYEIIASVLDFSSKNFTDFDKTTAKIRSLVAGHHIIVGQQLLKSEKRILCSLVCITNWVKNDRILFSSFHKRQKFQKKNLLFLPFPKHTHVNIARFPPNYSLLWLRISKNLNMQVHVGLVVRQADS